MREAEEGTGPARVDVAVIGAGLTGLVTSIALARAGACVALIDRASREALTAPTLDGRVTAVARGSKQFLDTIGVWPAMQAHAQPILDIMVGEGRSPLTVRYDHRAVGGEPLGYIVENAVMRRALMSALDAIDEVRFFERSTVDDVEVDASAARLTLGDGRSLQASLVAVCEGKNSPARARAGIPVRRRAYGQTGIVCTIDHQHPHDGMAIERFFSDGPFAVLPMQGGRRSSIVWALADEHAQDIAGLSDGALAAEIAARFVDRLGTVEIAGPRFYYPLTLAWATRCTAARLALVGDAAHGIHPIAGQGWNLALRDVAALGETVEDRLRLGLDPGTASALARYERWRRFDALALVAVTDGINRLFANDILPLKVLRNLGLGMVERLPPAKLFFMRHAMGLAGELPRALRAHAPVIPAPPDAKAAERSLGEHVTQAPASSRGTPSAIGRS